MSSYVIGLTGGIACGKTNLSNALRVVGAPVIDADEISRSLTAPGGRALPAIRNAFGNEVFTGDTLDRKALGEIVFSNPDALAQLNALTHPLIFQIMREEMEKYPGPVVLDVPLLFETGLDKWCDEIWCAYLPQKDQLARLMARDGITRKAALQRIHAQMPALVKAKKSHHVIRTTGSKEESAAIVLSLWRRVTNTFPLEKGDQP
ncbi:MAG: dephospho-CoA kinase [Clostridiales bacterium]|nr:dephospho-CoA kinase [Clostridiales bacterium]